MANDERLARSIIAALDLPAGRLRPLGSGLSSEAWLVGASEGDLVLRIATDRDDGAPTYPAEHAIMTRLAALDAPVPVPVRGSWQLADWTGSAFSLTTLVAGAPMHLPADRPAVRQIAGFLHLLHSIPVAGFGPIAPGADGADGGAGLAGAALDPAAGLQAWMGGAPLWPFDESRLETHPALVDRPGLRARIVAQRESIEQTALAGPAVLVHSDLHEENILESPGPEPGSTGENRLGFIDFGEAFIGSANWDLAALAYFLGWPVADAVLAEARRADGLGDQSVERDRPATEPARRSSVAALGLSFGLYRWWQDRHRGIDDETHDEAFIRDSLERIR